MVSTNRVSRIIATACLVCAPCTGVPLDAQPAVPAARSWQSASTSAFTRPSSLPTRFTLKEPLSSIVTLAPSVAPPLAQRGWGRGRGRGRNGGARAAIILGSVAAVAGSAVLVYANRPECSANHSASGCGYGTKVLGGAVLAGGAVSIAAGALTWR
jgi:hypothetical protein